jgi:hypothetical protein
VVAGGSDGHVQCVEAVCAAFCAVLAPSFVACMLSLDSRSE